MSLFSPFISLYVLISRFDKHFIKDTQSTLYVNDARWCITAAFSLLYDQEDQAEIVLDRNLVMCWDLLPNSTPSSSPVDGEPNGSFAMWREGIPRMKESQGKILFITLSDKVEILNPPNSWVKDLTIRQHFCLIQSQPGPLDHREETTTGGSCSNTSPSINSRRPCHFPSP